MFFYANEEPHEKSFMQNMANITPKSNGTYLIRISCGTDAAGEQISKSRVFKPSKPNLSYHKLNLEMEAFIKEFEEEIAVYSVGGRPDKIRSYRYAKNSPGFPTAAISILPSRIL